MKPAADSRFERRTHADKSVDSICLACFRTVKSETGHDELGLAEAKHVCSVEDLDSVRPARLKARKIARPHGVDSTNRKLADRTADRPADHI